MSISKGKVVIDERDLAKLFNLPEGAEIMAVKKTNFGEDGFEFLIMSRDEIEGLTKPSIPTTQMRRVRVPLENEDLALDKEIKQWSEHTGKLAILHDNPQYITKEDAEKLIEASSKVDARKIADELIRKNREATKRVIGKTNFNIDVEIFKQDEKDVKELFDDIVKNVKNNGGNI